MNVVFMEFVRNHNATATHLWATTPNEAQQNMKENTLQSRAKNDETDRPFFKGMNG